MRGSDGLGVLRRDLDEDEHMLVDGIRTTTRAVTVLDAVAELGPLAGADLMDRALLRGRVTVETLLAAHRAGLGRWGSRTAGEVLALAAGGARFEAERRLHRALRAAGVEGWLADVTITLPGYGEALLDLAFRAERIVVEGEESTPIGGGLITGSPTTSGATATARTRSSSPAGPSSG